VPYLTDYSANHIPPLFMITGTLGVRLFDEKLTLGTRVTYAGRPKVPSVTGMAGDLHTHWEPFTSVDLFGSLQVNEHMVWNLSAENITDRYFIDPLGGAGLPAPGRTLRTSLTTKF
jgi:hemoglobin/transferrin/lactoferrin receptor protein